MSNLIGQSLGRYHILEQLGEGGMATVYKAYDTRLEADVAVKVIRREAFPAEHHNRIFKRFDREANALAKLSHPNIVKVIEYGQYEGSPFLVMEYIPAGTLKEKLGKPIVWFEALDMLIPIAKALAYSHQHHIIHRDVKPSNILVTKAGELKLTDFGIAKVLENDEGQTFSTGTGVGVGTPEYMSPEQGMGKEVDARADVYSLGVVLYEMLTGHKPYIADTPMAVIVKHINDPLPHLKKFTNNLPDSVERLLLKALAKAPKDRYQDMGGFGRAMEEVVLTHKKQVATALRRKDQANYFVNLFKSIAGSFTKKLEKFINNKARGKKLVHPKVPAHAKRVEFKLPIILRRTAITVGVMVIGIGLLVLFSKSLSALPAQLFSTSESSNTPTLIFTSTPGNTPTPIFTATPYSTVTTVPYPDEISDKKGVPMRLVPAGAFIMGITEEDYIIAHSVYLDAFYIDTYEVTNGRYAECVNAGVCDPPSPTGSNTRSIYYGSSQFDTYPVVFVGWSMAQTYCKWRGADLPTEAHWEKAARGTDARTYPWGEGVDCNYANYDRSCASDTTAIGSYESGVSPYGLYDMAGNVGEWVADWYDEFYSSFQEIAYGRDHAIRGGGSDIIYSGVSLITIPEKKYGSVGFRCSRGISP